LTIIVEPLVTPTDSISRKPPPPPPAPTHAPPPPPPPTINTRTEVTSAGTLQLQVTAAEKVKTLNPPEVVVVTEHSGRDVAETVALPPVYPVRVVVIVAVDEVPIATPVTVTSPVPLIETVPLAVALPPHV
jgi:hypothetical protein